VDSAQVRYILSFCPFLGSVKRKAMNIYLIISFDDHNITITKYLALDQTNFGYVLLNMTDSQIHASYSILVLVWNFIYSKYYLYVSDISYQSYVVVDFFHSYVLVFWCLSVFCWFCILAIKMQLQPTVSSSTPS